MKRSWLVVLLSGATLLTGLGSAHAAPTTPDIEQATRYVVSFAATAPTDPAALASAATGIPAQAEPHAAGAVLSFEQPLSEPQAAALRSQLMSSAGVLAVEPDALFTPSHVPSDPFYPNQWHLSRADVGIDLQPALDVSRGAWARVAVLDTGVTAHDDIKAQLVGGYDFISDPGMARDATARDADPTDAGDAVAAGACYPGSPASWSSWHGTKAIGVIGASMDNGFGIASIAPGSQVVPVRIMGACGGWGSDMADAIVWSSGGSITGVPANPNPAKVILVNAAYSSYPNAYGACPTYLQNAINTAYRNGALVIAPAGNQGVDAGYVQPANCANVLTVGATDNTGTRSVWGAASSNFGNYLELSAPGSQGWSATNLGEVTAEQAWYGEFRGTSMAAAHVAGVATLAHSVNPALSPDQLRHAIIVTAAPLPRCASGCGWGLADATALVTGVGGFVDVPRTLPFNVEITWASYQGISTGWPVGNGTANYRPLELVRRDAMAAFLYRSAGSPGYTPPATSPFTDVSPAHPFYREICWLRARGISTGYADGSYRPQNSVTREAMAAFLYRLAGAPSYTPPAVSPFIDVATSHPFYREISWLRASGISGGYPDGRFAPAEPVRRDAMAAFLYRGRYYHEF